MRALKSRQAGQSTLEFILTMILTVSFILFFFQLSMVFAIGNYVQYATFMAARAYLAAGPSQSDQEERATNVMKSALKQPANPNKDRFSSILKGVGGDGTVTGMTVDPSPFSATDATLSWLQGVRYTFQATIFILPFGQGSPSGSQNSVTLNSETFLGREPSAEECQQEMSTNRGGGIFDNGC